MLRGVAASIVLQWNGYKGFSGRVPHTNRTNASCVPTADQSGLGAIEQDLLPQRSRVMFDVDFVPFALGLFLWLNPLPRIRELSRVSGHLGRLPCHVHADSPAAHV
jgi:hypothetical protein